MTRNNSVLISGAGIAGLTLAMNFKPQAKPSPQAMADTAFGWSDRLQWVMLAFVPSALLAMT